MGDVQRWDLEWHGPPWRETQDMFQREDGDWVTYEDHAAEVARLRERIAELEAERSDVDHACRVLRGTLEAQGGSVLVDRGDAPWIFCDLDNPERLPSRVLAAYRDDDGTREG